MNTGRIKITGVNATIRQLLKVNKAVRYDFTKAMSKATKIVADKAKVYPPKLPAQKYVRTYKLKRGWRQEKATATHGAVANRGVPYAHYVQSDRWQAAIHEGRWNTESGIVKQTEKKVQQLFDKVIKRAVG